MGIRVLCIDDNSKDLELLYAVLESCGYEVEGQTDPSVGIKLFMLEDYDVVILDYHLLNTDGGILAEEMRRRKPKVPIIFVSGFPERAKLDGNVGLLIEKRTSTDELRNCLSEAVASVTVRSQKAV